MIGPIYTIADIFEDPQYLARETITTVDDPMLGRARVQNAIPRLVDTPGRGAPPGRRPRARTTTTSWGDELGHSREDLERWAAAGVIGRDDSRLDADRRKDGAA